MKPTNGYLSRKEFWELLTKSEKDFFTELNDKFNITLVRAKRRVHEKEPHRDTTEHQSRSDSYGILSE